MENTSLSEAVEQLFAQNGADEIARRFIERGSEVYADSGETLEQTEGQVIDSFEIKLPVNGPLPKEYIEGFCAHMAKQAEMFLAPPNPSKITLLGLTDSLVPANNNTVALAA